MGRGWTCAVVGAVVGWLMVVPGAMAERGEGQQDGSWSALGPAGELPITALRVSPDWPRDRLILALRTGRLIRSRDGGGRWDLLPTPEVFTSLELVPSGGSQPLAFATSRSNRQQTVYRSTTAGGDWQRVLLIPDEPTGLSGQPGLIPSPSFAQDRDPVIFLNSGQHLYRSTDAGASWTQLAVDGGLRLSPAFGSDGLAFVLSAGQALASRDRGLTWDDAGVAPDQWVQDVRFSPTFASDNTIFATARLDPSADDSATSYGVLMSTDAGATWFQSSDGMAVDGVPYLSAVDLIVSPTYAQDQTLYVAAFGPRTEATEGRFSTWPWALFQSVDRGVSWQAVTVRAGYPDRDPRATLALSPAFAQDGRVLLTEVGGLLSRRPSGCTAQLSSDGGSTWTPVDPRWLDRYWSCGTPRLLGLPDQLVGAFQDGGEGGTGWNVWVETAAGPEWFRLPRQVTARPSAAADGTVFLGTSSGGIWARGPGARSTPGSLTCPIEPVLGFGRVYAADAWARDVLGCALDVEHRIGIHQSISRGKPAYMLDDDLASWYVLYDDRWEIFQTQYSPFPTADERVYSGPVQHFEGGVMVYTTEPNSQHQILVLAGVAAGRSWRAWPEPPR